MLRLLLIVVLVLMLIGSLPVWTFSNGWGYAPVSTVGVVVLVLLVIAFRGRSKV